MKRQANTALADPLQIDRRPLYLDPRAGTRARLSIDGPALRIRIDHKADRYLPLRRVSRILAGQRTELSTEVILACAERGITIVLVDDTGVARARILGRPGERQELRQRLLDFMIRGDWRDLYASWLYSTRQNIRIGVHRQLQVPRHIGLGRDLSEWLNQTAAEHSDPDTAAATRRWLWELTDAWLLNHLNQLGFGAQSELLLDGRPDIVSDLSRLLHWQIEPIRLGWLRRRRQWSQRTGRAPAPACRRDMIAVYEKNAARIGRLGRKLTNRLHLWLVEID